MRGRYIIKILTSTRLREGGKVRKKIVKLKTVEKWKLDKNADKECDKKGTGVGEIKVFFKRNIYPWPPEFYYHMFQDPERYSMPFQSYVQLTMLDQHLLPTEQPVKLMERSIFSSRLVVYTPSTQIFDENFRLCWKIYRHVNSFVT